MDHLRVQISPAGLKVRSRYGAADEPPEDSYNVAVLELNGNMWCSAMHVSASEVPDVIADGVRRYVASLTR